MIARRPAVVLRLALAFTAAGSLAAPAGHGLDEDASFAEARERMVQEQLAAGPFRHPITDPRVLEAMRQVPRHRFVPPEIARLAYTDQPLPIGEEQTISQPYIVALMTELAAVQPGDRVLEIGTGSGYQAAVLASLGGEVYSIEILEGLARRAGETLQALGYAVRVRAGDGFFGWPEAAPFDAILVTAAAPRVPQLLIDQLKEGGRLVIPLGEAAQELAVFRKSAGGLSERRVIPVRFVPMTGAVERP
ncbi:MAG: protein-L-isoaspartate(D-aspartate) O-methyltransferase [Candidatus Omnitrophica bacterium]|nr:protein-L-isoaspartate(D-aspartate) O-methyltransferase [Candidatus Omnitrophota bacterium]